MWKCPTCGAELDDSGDPIQAGAGATLTTAQLSGLRQRLAGEFHIAGQCGSDGGTFDQVLKSGYECCCYEAADLVLEVLRSQLQAQPLDREWDECLVASNFLMQHWSRLHLLDTATKGNEIRKLLRPLFEAAERCGRSTIIPPHDCKTLGERMGDGAPAKLLQKIEGILGRCVFDQPDSLDYEEGVALVRVLPELVAPAKAQLSEEQVREIAEIVHHKLCAAQNLPWEEGDCCDECIHIAKDEIANALLLRQPRKVTVVCGCHECSYHGMVIKQWEAMQQPNPAPLEIRIQAGVAPRQAGESSGATKEGEK